MNASISQKEGNDMNKRSRSILAVVVAILLVIVVVLSVAVNVLFSMRDTPRLFGHYIYMMEYDTMEARIATGVTALADVSSADSASSAASSESSDAAANDAASIHQYTAVVCSVYDSSDPIARNNAVLCRLGEGDASTDVDSDGLAIRRIYSIEQDSTGVLLYYPTTMRTEEIGTEPAITIDSILGKCIYESGELYSFITFTTSVAGILVLLVLPCVILAIMLVVAIARANSRVRDDYAYEENNYDEVYDDDSYDDDYSEELGQQPLYRTGSVNTAGSGGNSRSFERKRSTIAENFERKAVNPNSPYQKARTMQFKVQREGQPAEQAPEQSAPAQEQPAASAPPVRREPISHATDTPISALSEATNYRGSHEAASPEEARNLGDAPPARSARRATTSSAPSASASSASSRGKDKYDSASIDELLAMIENEKKKLN